MAVWQKIEVAASRPYPVFLGVPLEELGEYIKTRLGYNGSLLVITNDIVGMHYTETLLKGLGEFKVNVLTIPAGEQEKSLERINDLVSQALSLETDRSAMVVALGGGVVGDLAGFFASIYMRGIRFIQVPTTLLAQVDSSIGGKVAVNHSAGKNIIGAFYPPVAVWTDFNVLQTLPWDEVQNGLAETIKHAIIADSDFFSFLESHRSSIADRDEAVWREMISRSIAVKVKFVSQDEREQGLRALLNLGHSFGHALETVMAYQGISHGEGVSVGIVAAASLALKRGYIVQSDLQRIVSLLKYFGLPVTIEGQDPLQLLQKMGADKKNTGGKKVLILPKGIGQAVVVKDCTDDEILQAWKEIII